MKILWLAPVYNHYKALFLQKLVERTDMDIHVLMGRTNTKLGHTHGSAQGITEEAVGVSKKYFGLHPMVYMKIVQMIFRENYDCVMVPAERRFFPIIVFVFLLRQLKGFTYFAYNQSLVQTLGTPPKSQVLIAKLLFSFYDKVILYTENSMKRVVHYKIMPQEKAFYANNTIDTEKIFSVHQFNVNTSGAKTLLLIGRLLPYRRLDLLLEYYHELKKQMQDLRLFIIGDGPEAATARAAAEGDADITWVGAVTDEAQIAQWMDKAHAVFMPGHTGLSVVHAFCYGKPYFALQTYTNHPPEIEYLQDGANGLFLSGDVQDDVGRMAELLGDPDAYAKMCESALATAKEISVGNWCDRIYAALKASPEKQ